ncbi:MAG: DUF4935 domain-containing protein [Chitinophagales bacterium]|nr:DUF4935 domain-containing protein [Chitinophagales bacterium]
MENLIFIDANMYLRFFDTNSSEYKKLLKSILEVKDNIFITDQIENEVLRNKMIVFLGTFNQYIKQIEGLKVNLPEHLDEKEKKLNEWNQKKEVINTSINELKGELEDIVTNLVQMIIENKDEVSIVLSQLFANAQKETQDQLDRARKRKEIGNPPGKKNDPLGDQLSWEQLLDNIDSVNNLWIITNDRDFASEFKKTHYLNALLLKDLKAKNSNLNVHCFNTLGEGLRSYNSIISKKIHNLPTEESLETIIEEEKHSLHLENLINFPSQSIGFPQPTFPSGFDIWGRKDQFAITDWGQKNSFQILQNYPDIQNTTNCPKCGSTKLIKPKNIKVNPIYKCTNCGNNYKVKS